MKPEPTAKSSESIPEGQVDLALALEVASDGLWVWDIPRGRFSYSERMAELLGCELRDLDTSQADLWHNLASSRSPDPALDKQVRAGQHRLRGDPWHHMPTHGGVLEARADGENRREDPGKPRGFCPRGTCVRRPRG